MFTVITSNYRKLSILPKKDDLGDDDGDEGDDGSDGNGDDGDDVVAGEESSSKTICDI